MLAFVVGVLGWVLARGVVSGGGVVARLWAGVVGRVRVLVSGVGAWGLVLAGLVGVVVLVGVLVLVGWCLVVAWLRVCGRVRLSRVSCCFVWV